MGLAGNARTALSVGGFLEIEDMVSDTEYWELVSWMYTDSENIWCNLEEWEAIACFGSSTSGIIDG